MFQTGSDCFEAGIALSKEFIEYLAFLKAEFFHENLPKSLQEMADKGLESITGLNMEKWEGFGKMLEKSLQTSAEISEEQLFEWRESLQKFQQFLNLMPRESYKYYDDIDGEMISIHKQGSELLEKMVCWLDMENKGINADVITVSEGGAI